MHIVRFSTGEEGIVHRLLPPLECLRPSEVFATRVSDRTSSDCCGCHYYLDAFGRFSRHFQRRYPIRWSIRRPVLTRPSPHCLETKWPLWRDRSRLVWTDWQACPSDWGYRKETEWMRPARKLEADWETDRAKQRRRRRERESLFSIWSAQRRRRLLREKNERINANITNRWSKEILQESKRERSLQATELKMSNTVERRAISSCKTSGNGWERERADLGRPLPFVLILSVRVSIADCEGIWEGARPIVGDFVGLWPSSMSRREGKGVGSKWSNGGEIDDGHLPIGNRSILFVFSIEHLDLCD